MFRFFCCQVHKCLELEEGEEPCAIQIRYGGCKGMLLLDPTMSGKRIVFRDSMEKFHSDHEDLYVLKTSKPSTYLCHVFFRSLSVF